MNVSVVGRDAGYEATSLQEVLADPTERDLVAGLAAEAAREAWRAFVALVFALAKLAAACARSVWLRRSARRIREESEGSAIGAELTVLALERILSGTLARLLGPGRVLALFGAREVPWEDGARSLVVATRSYGGSGPRGEPAARVKAVIGVRCPASGEPSWCVLRYAKAAPGRWRRVHEERGPCPRLALISFFSERAASPLAVEAGRTLARHTFSYVTSGSAPRVLVT